MLFGYQLPELKNIINMFRWKNILTIEEKDDIELSMGTLIDNFIEGDALGFSNPYFELNLKEYVFKNMLMSLREVFYANSNCNGIGTGTGTGTKASSNIPLDTRLEDELETIYLKIHKHYFTKYYPPRSYNDSFIRIDPNIEQMAIKINDIENKPQPEQRTTEWYEFRYNLITASSAWKAFKSQAAINQLIVEKCKDLNVSKYDTINTGTPMHHGNKYEDVSIMLYESMYSTKVKDYGCIQHDTHKFIGASPDGINVEQSSSRYGRMLEIKNPTTREITGIPKEDYWIQMQLQMETCNLNECDFLETAFKEYDSEEDFKNDGTTFTHTEEGQLKGMILYFMKEGKPFYEYMPLHISKEESDIWYDEIMAKNNDLTWIKDIHWWLDEYSCVLVLRNKLWFENAVSKIQDVWTIIEKERKTGYEHRLPKKKNIRSRSNTIVDVINNTNNTCLVEMPNNTNNTNNTCLIDINNL